MGRIQALQLDYTDAYTKLMQSSRKAPQNTAIGFQRAAQKLIIIVQVNLTVGPWEGRKRGGHERLRRGFERAAYVMWLVGWGGWHARHLASAEPSDAKIQQEHDKF